MSNYRKNLIRCRVHVIPGHNPDHNIGGSPGTPTCRDVGHRCMPGSMRKGGCQPGLVCSAGGDMGIPVCRDPRVPPLGPGGFPPHPHNLGPGGLPPHHSTPTHYRGLGSKCNFMAGAGNQMGCMQGECLGKDGRVVGPGKIGNCMASHPPHRPSPGQPSPTPHHRHSIPTQYRGCVVGDRNNNCGKNNYCKPLSSRSSKLGGRGLCTTIPTPIPIVVPSGVGGRCNYSTHPQQPCKSNLVCNAGPGVGGDGTCVIPGRVHPHQRPVPVVVPSGVGGRCNYSTHPQQPCKSNLVCNAGPGVGGDGTCVIPGRVHPHQRPVPAHLALPNWDIGVGEADFGNISIANVGDIYLPVQNYMGEEGPGPQAPSMWRPGQGKNYHYK